MYILNIAMYHKPSLCLWTGSGREQGKVVLVDFVCLVGWYI